MKKDPLYEVIDDDCHDSLKVRLSEYGPIVLRQKWSDMLVSEDQLVKLANMIFWYYGVAPTEYINPWLEK